jgi:hypothetical protein
VADYLAAATRPDRRDARVHRVMPVLWFALTDALREGRDLDLGAYEDRLRGLRTTTTTAVRAVPGRSRAG